MQEEIVRSRRLSGKRRLLAAGALALGMAGGLGGAAWGVTSPYQPSQQDCYSYSSDYATPVGMTYPGCHNMAVNVESGNGTRYVEWGNDQVPNDPNSVGTPTILSVGEPGYTGSPHSGCVAANTAGTGGGSGTGCGSNANGAGFEANYDYYALYCPVVAAAGQACEDTNTPQNSLTVDQGNTVDYQDIVNNGLLVYFGMDDNTDNGEHDGLGPYSTGCTTASGQCNPNNDQAENGSSDGGSVVGSVTPQNATNTPSATHPEGLANGTLGFCADGICGAASTQQYTVYHGGNSSQPNANVYDYAPGNNPDNAPAVNNESPNCNSGDANSTSAANCGTGGMNAWRAATPANENVEPGVQIFADPDPQRSPATGGTPFWPTPAVYAGTCGVYAGSPNTTGQILPANQSAGPQQVTNADGQLALDDGQCDG